MIKIGEKYRIVNHSKEINDIIVKVIEYDEVFKIHLCEIDDKSLLDNWRIHQFFHNNGNIFKNSYYIWIFEKKLKSLRSDKLKRLLK